MLCRKTVSLKLLAENQEDYYNISEETCELLAVLTKSKELLETARYRNEAGGGINMCKALEDMKQESMEKGIEKGISILVADYQGEGFSRNKIIGKLINGFSISEEQAEKYFDRFSVNV